MSGFDPSKWPYSKRDPNQWFCVGHNGDFPRVYGIGRTRKEAEAACERATNTFPLEQREQAVVVLSPELAAQLGVEAGPGITATADWEFETVRLQMVWDNLSCLGTEALARLG
jgi:hypothetical protein